MTQRGDVYIKIFNTLPGLMSWNFIIVKYSLHQSSETKTMRNQNNDSPFTLIRHAAAINLFFNLPDIIM